MPAGKARWSGVVDATIAAMEKLGARRERVPRRHRPLHRRGDSYEVGPEFPAPFLAQDQANAAFFRAGPRAGHFMFDLAGYLLQRLGAGRRGRERHRPRHAGGARRFLQLSPQHAAAACATTAAACRPSRSGDDVPYLIILMFCCLLGVIATCAML